MPIKLPVSGRWSQPNNSDKFGSIWATKSINLDEEGYIKLSPRTVTVMDQAENGDFGVPVAIGRHDTDQYQVATTSDANFNAQLATTASTISENNGTNEPTLDQDSHGKFFDGRWFVTAGTKIWSKVANGADSAAWADSGRTLTTGKRHNLEVFASRNQLCASNGNTIDEYVHSGSGTLDAPAVTLTIPSDFEITGMAYNGGRMGIITKLEGTSLYQNKEAMFYIWDGATTSATGFGIGSDMGVTIAPYKSSFVITTRTGEKLYFNGNGFTPLEKFPFYYTDKIWGSFRNFMAFGDAMVVEGDTILTNMGNEMFAYGKRGEYVIQNFPGGIWCYDPKIGLYHKYAPSISKMYFVSVAVGGVNTTTDVITGTGTIPATGNIARYIGVNNSASAIGGLTVNEDYYIIKVSSTTFKLAETKEKALEGVSIDLTAAAGDTSTFYMYDLVDYGATFYEDAGAITIPGSSNHIYKDILFGGDFLTTSLGSNDSLCAAVPYLENRGWFITPKLYAENPTNKNQKLIVRFRPLDTNDAIIVKGKAEDVLGLPVSSPNATTTDEAVWVGKREFYTTTDLSDAKAYLDAGNELEVEFTAGVGGGQMVKITDIEEEDGTYSVTLEDEVIGATSGLKSYFSVDNWKVLGKVLEDQKGLGYAEIPIDDLGASKWVQFKIELRGNGTCIEEIFILTGAHKQE